MLRMMRSVYIPEVFDHVNVGAAQYISMEFAHCSAQDLIQLGVSRFSKLNV